MELSFTYCSADDHYLDKFRKLSLYQINQVLLRNRQQLQRDRETTIAECLFSEHSGILLQCNSGGRFRFDAEFNTFAWDTKLTREPWMFESYRWNSFWTPGFQSEYPFYLKLKKVNGNDWVLEEDSNFSHRYCFVWRGLLLRFWNVLYSHRSQGDQFFPVTPDQASICLNENRFLNVPLYELWKN